MADTHPAPAPNPLVKLKSPWAVSAILVLAVAIFDTAQTLPFLETAIAALLSTLPYILFAVFLIAYLKAAGAETMIAKAFKGREGRTIVMAALLRLPNLTQPLVARPAYATTKRRNSCSQAPITPRLLRRMRGTGTCGWWLSPPTAPSSNSGSWYWFADDFHRRAYRPVRLSGV